MRIKLSYYIGFVEMAESEWLSWQPNDSEKEFNYWPWFYLLLAAMTGEI